MTITTTGYYSTGSSAVYDLLREYNACTEEINKNNPVEHILLYMPNGLFDLEDKLLIGNSILIGCKMSLVHPCLNVLTGKTLSGEINKHKVIICTA